MLTKLNSSFKLLGGYFQEYGKSCNKSSYIASSSKMVIGLQSLIQTSYEEQSNIILKSAMKITHQTLPPASMEPCFLKSCFLCSKNFSMDKEIYMYRGDQGYCSIECRNRQIYLDEIQEIEQASIRRSNYRYCSSSGRRETRQLLEDLRRRNAPVTVTDHQNHWAIVSFS
ncbi:FCS-Like Zinc finger 17 [Euphorbia lathyris]|uniref:FCS-Like Zinc finger 17 n=1 Tax=Euphorbia lathyris TaxID=212925 RepID=UPI0033138241